MLRWLIVLLVAVSCSNNDNGGDGQNGATATRNLNIESINDNCLNLQSVAEQMTRDSFAFPGLVYTRDFQILSAVSPAFSDSLVASSWRAHTQTIEEVSDLKGLTQPDCETLSLTGFHATRIPFKITDFSKEHLEFELDQAALKEALSALPDDQRDAVLDFPGIRKYTVRVIDPTQLEVTSYYETVPTACAVSSTPEIRETTVYDWSTSPQLRVKPTYWRKLGEIAGVDEIGAGTHRENDDIELISIDGASSAELSRALEERSYAVCQ